MAIQIRLDNFNGPLDLLLHLIKSNEMDITAIRIFEITEQYLSIIEEMKQLDLDVAGEFLLMAASLIQIKSRLLLPTSDDISEEEETDPRAELIRRLLEYQRYKEAARSFAALPRMNRDVYSNQVDRAGWPAAAEQQDEQLAVGIYQLAQAFHQLLQNRPAEVFHEVVRETLAVADFVERIAERLKAVTRLPLSGLVAERGTREELIVTFLALLELVKQGLVKVEQMGAFSEIWLSAAVPVDRLDTQLPRKDELSYG
jgi:segregation and condensation protein A